MLLKSSSAMKGLFCFKLPIQLPKERIGYNRHGTGITEVFLNKQALSVKSAKSWLRCQNRAI